MPKNVLIMRFSAIGDVAMCIPVIYSAASQNPRITFTVMTQPFLQNLFINAPRNIKFLPIDIKGDHHSFRNLIKFAREIPDGEYDTVIDLHNVIRSRILGYILSIKGAKVYVLDKQRKERKRIVKGIGPLTPLAAVTSRYRETIMESGIFFKESFFSLFELTPPDMSQFDNLIWSSRKFATLTQPDGASAYKYFIGIATFAAHERKILPVAKMEQVVRELSKRGDTYVYLFGGKGKEEAILRSWGNLYPNVISMVGRTDLSGELALMSTLDLLISMDSANMHFASLVNTRVISIWGATHPYTGFLGYNQRYEDAIQLDMICRPCSIYGKEKCKLGKTECLEGINPEMILQRVMQVLNTGE